MTEVDDVPVRGAPRLKGWTPKTPDITIGYLARYAKLVSSANEGAVLK